MHAGNISVNYVTLFRNNVTLLGRDKRTFAMWKLFHNVPPVAGIKP